MSQSDLEPLERLRHRFQLRNRFTVNLLAEFFGTFFLLFAGSGIVSQFVLSKRTLNVWLNVNFGFGLLVALCVYATFHTSGGHLNPAVSLAMVTIGKLSVSHFFAYFAVQTFAAYLGAAGAYIVYYDEIQHFTGGNRTIIGPTATAGMYTSFPKPHLSHATCFLDQFVGTMMLLLFVFIIVDKRNRIPVGIQPLLIGIGLFVVGNCFGMNLGYPVNPARDLGPRIFTWTAGYGWEVFSYQNYYSWIPVIAPLCGGVFGTWLYQIFIGFHNLDMEELELMPTKRLLADGGQSEMEPLNS